MKITYIHHSSFAVELDSAILLFDYYKGRIPAFDKSKPIFVFASHNHYDHFNNDVFQLSDLYTKVTYILSDDITPTNEYSDKNIIYVKANQTLTLPVSDSESIYCETFKSTDEGVAFLLTIGDKVIYHAGDLHWWAWEEDTKEDALAMELAFKKEVDRLEGKHIDVAFLPLDGRLNKNYSLGFDYFMKHTNTEYAYPMHFWKDYSIIGTFKESNEAKTYKDKIMDINQEFQEYII